MYKTPDKKCCDRVALFSAKKILFITFYLLLGMQICHVKKYLYAYIIVPVLFRFIANPKLSLSTKIWKSGFKEKLLRVGTSGYGGS